jgi:glycosyltransferase involved in cell wall biosynthesis
LGDNSFFNKSELPSFEQRNDFVFVGNFIHPPNADAVLFLKEQIWPKLRQKLPHSTLHIYGAYPKPKHLNLQDKKHNFFVHGFVEDIDATLQSARVLLAPLQFGAGLKGKVIDALRNGTPCVLSSVAAEGIFNEGDQHSFVCDDPAIFIEKSIELYTNQDLWTSVQSKGFETLKSRFMEQQFRTILMDKIEELSTKLEAHRLQNFTGILLQHHSMQSTKYFSKWIEAKNKGL